MFLFVFISPWFFLFLHLRCFRVPLFPPYLFLFLPPFLCSFSLQYLFLNPWLLIIHHFSSIATFLILFSSLPVSLLPFSSDLCIYSGVLSSLSFFFLHPSFAISFLSFLASFLFSLSLSPSLSSKSISTYEFFIFFLFPFLFDISLSLSFLRSFSPFLVSLPTIYIFQ